MLDPKIVNYIKDARAKNISDEVIRQALILNGWNDAQVTEALNVTDVIAAAPVGPDGQKPQAHLSAVIRKHHTAINSSLSVLLAIVLFFALFILANHIVKDLTSGSTDVSLRLITNSFIAVPFLLIAFILHYSFHENENKAKYLIVAQPYYWVSGWLLIKLLFEVSSYILDSNAAYGVYIVLILIVAVLTGIIFFVQKYIKKQ